jgi:putative NADH-flavin reductase
MKTIALIGASGFVGSAILREALTRGFRVKALVRNASKVKVDDEHLEVIEVDVMDKDKLAATLKGVDIVVSAYNPGWSNPHIYAETLEGYKSIIEAVKKAGVKRLLTVGGAGSLLVAPGKTIIDTGEIPEEILPGVKALAEVLKNYLIPEKGVDWIFFSPAATLKPGERTGKYRLGKDNLIVDENGESEISVQDYAKAMIDEVVSPQHHYQRFTIGY